MTSGVIILTVRPPAFQATGERPDGHYSSTFVLLVAIAYCTIVFKDVGVVVNLVGALLGSTCLFGFPGLFSACEQARFGGGEVGGGRGGALRAVLRRSTPFALMAVSVCLACTGVLM